MTGEYPQVEPPLRETNPPLTPEQQEVTLGRGDRAPEPQTPEQWALHACESMAAIAEVVQGVHGRYRGEGYRPINPNLPGVNVLYFDSGRDAYEVRIQPPLPRPIIPDGATREQILALMGPEANQRRQEQTPEYRWSSLQAQGIWVQQHRQQRPISAMSPEEAEEHARYLRGVAIYAAGDAQNSEVLGKLIPQEVHE